MRPTGDFPQTLSGGRDHVLRRLGSGGTSTVFLAHDTLLRRDVAVKRMHGAEVTAETSLRLRREAQIIAALRHPNLVAVFDTSATLQIETIATHAQRVDHCTGTLRTVRGPDRRWLVEPAGVRCTSE
jgi:serine/threonine protein kinase